MSEDKAPERAKPRNFTLPDSTMAQLDQVRARLPGVPNKSDALRQIIAFAVENMGSDSDG